MYFDDLKEFLGVVLFLPLILLKEVARRIWEHLTEQIPLQMLCLRCDSPMGEVRMHLPALSIQMTAINSTECLAQNACEHQGNWNIK